MNAFLKGVLKILGLPFRALSVALIWLIQLMPGKSAVEKQAVDGLKWAGGNILWSVLSSAAMAVVGLGAVGASGIYGDPWKANLPEPCSQERICVAVAGLHGDTDGRQTAHIVYTLNKLFDDMQGTSPVQIQILPRRIARALPGESGRNNADALAEANEWLARQKADMLIYGVVAREDAVLRLDVISNRYVSDGGYALTSTLELPVDFGEDLGNVLASEIAASTDDSTKLSDYATDVLDPIIARLAPLAASLPEGLGREARFSLLHSYGLVLSTKGTMTRDVETLQESARAYEAALKEILPEEDAYDWAMLQNNLANVYDGIGVQTYDPDFLEKAIAAYEAAMTVWTKDDWPQDWALALNNLGSSYYSIGTMRDDREALQKSFDNYQQALEVWSEAENYTQWAMVLNNIADLFAWIGVEDQSADNLRQAIDYYEQALSVRTREAEPLYWAATTTSLADAWRALGVMESDAAAMRKALDLRRETLSVASRERAPESWAVTQVTISRDLISLAVAQEDEAMMREAVEAVTMAMEVIAEENVSPRVRASALYAYMEAQGALSENTQDADGLWKAAEAARELVDLSNALDHQGVLTSDSAEVQNAQCWYAAKAIEFSGSTEGFDQANEACKAAARTFSEKGEAVMAMMTMHSIGYLYMVMAELEEDAEMADRAHDIFSTLTELPQSEGFDPILEEAGRDLARVEALGL